MDPATIKQVIVMRTDTRPPMRKGKMIAQGSHASIAFLTRRIEQWWAPTRIFTISFVDRIIQWLYGKNAVVVVLKDDEREWLNNGRFTKVCLRVDSEEEFQDIYMKASRADLEVHLVTDSGQTEFSGQPTKTCLAIGPNRADAIDKVTGHLRLL